MSEYENTAGAEVAEDFRSALEDMTTVLRVEIMNLCQIARENTEFAVDIAHTLQTYILKAAPHRKLPALYVLDAIVKNVGSPYTLYLAPKLYQMFMESYATVDSNVRRKMEEMLRTWKQPVPGSIDTRPVFPVEVVQPIEDALMKASASAMQAQQKNLVGRPRLAQPRNTPSPMARNQAAFAAPPGAFAAPPAAPEQPTPPAAYRNEPEMVNVEELKSDVATLIRDMELAGIRNPRDDSIPKKVQALRDLQGLFIKGESLTNDQLILVKRQVDDLGQSIRTTLSTPTTPVPAAAAPPTGPKVTLDALLGRGALATLMARKNSTPTPPAINMQNVPKQPAAMRNQSPPTQPAAMRQHAPQAPIVPVMMQQQAPKVPASMSMPPAAPAQDINQAFMLMDQLRRAGLLPSAAGVPAPQMPVPTAPAAPAQTPILPSIIANALAAQRQTQQQNRWMTPAMEMNEIQLDAASLKQDHGNLLITMLDGLGKPCSQCGRRFKNDEAGKKKRVEHMDWHFKVHQRAAKAEKRGQHRSWYLDQKGWIAFREVVDADTSETASPATAAPKKAETQYIPVPDPSEGVNTACSICADKFVNKWLDSAQEWVWLDTMRVGNKVYHASCYNEAFQPRSTPEPMLGKRKAESPGQAPGDRKKWRTEVV